MKFLFDFLPALAFLIALFIPESREEGVYLATKVIIVTSFLQVIIAWIVTRRVEKQYLIILVVVLILGAATLLLHDERFIKWKPTIVFWVFSAICAGSEFIGHKNIPQRVMGHLFAAPGNVWSRVNVSLIVFFLLLGFVNLYVAYNFTTETWAFFKVFGIMGINFVYILGLVFYMSRYMTEIDKDKEESDDTNSTSSAQAKISEAKE